MSLCHAEYQVGASGRYSLISPIGISVLQSFGLIVLRLCAQAFHLRTCRTVVVSITFHQVDYAPDTKAGTDCNDQCLKNIDCTAKKSHNQMCEQTLFLMVCKRLALLLSLLFRPFFTCFICKAILSLSLLFSPFFLLLDFFLEKT